MKIRVSEVYRKHAGNDRCTRRALGLFTSRKLDGLSSRLFAVLLHTWNDLREQVVISALFTVLIGNGTTYSQRDVSERS